MIRLKQCRSFHQVYRPGFERIKTFLKMPAVSKAEMERRKKQSEQDKKSARQTSAPPRPDAVQVSVARRDARTKVELGGREMMIHPNDVSVAVRSFAIAVGDTKDAVLCSTSPKLHMATRSLVLSGKWDVGGKEVSYKVDLHSGVAEEAIVLSCVLSLEANPGGLMVTTRGIGSAVSRVAIGGKLEPIGIKAVKAKELDLDYDSLQFTSTKEMKSGMLCFTLRIRYVAAPL